MVLKNTSLGLKSEVSRSTRVTSLFREVIYYWRILLICLRSYHESMIKTLLSYFEEKQVTAPWSYTQYNYCQHVGLSRLERKLVCLGWDVAYRRKTIIKYFISSKLKYVRRSFLRTAYIIFSRWMLYWAKNLWNFSE